MSAVSIRQLWSRAGDLFNENALLLAGLLALAIIVGFIPFIGALIAEILLWPALVRAGYLVARKGQPSFGEVFRDLSLLLKVFVYDFLILELIPLIGLGYMLALTSPIDEVVAGVAALYTEGVYESLSRVMALAGTRGTLLVAGFIVLSFILHLFFWAGPYAILSGRAGISSAIGQSFSLTWQNFSKVFVALLSFIGLLILGLLPLGLGLLMEVPILIVGGEYLYGLWLLVVGAMASVFLPLLYLALTGEEGASHA